MMMGNVRRKDPRLGEGSLYAPLPIPACKALTFAGCGAARNVLVAILLHWNESSPEAFPTHRTIAKFSNVGSNQIKEAIQLLVRFGFVRVHQKKVGKNKRNSYEILRAAWHWDEFNHFARNYRYEIGWCTECLILVYRPDWHFSTRTVDGFETSYKIHSKCYSYVKSLKRAQYKEILNLEKSARDALKVTSEKIILNAS